MTQLKWLMYYGEKSQIGNKCIPNVAAMDGVPDQKTARMGQSDAPSSGLEPDLQFTGLRRGAYRTSTSARDHSEALTPCLQPEVLHLLNSDCVTF
jgi:hypothetical protein